MTVSRSLQGAGRTEEEYDSFRIDDDVPGGLLVDPETMAVLADPPRRPAGGGSRASRSAATTRLATDVGSTVGARKNPFLKSITFFDPKVYYRTGADSNDEGDEEKRTNDDDVADDMTFEINDLTHWEIKLKDPPKEDWAKKKGGLVRKLSGGLTGKSKKKNLLIVEDFDGLVEFSSLEPGDRLVSINKKKIVPEEYSAEEAEAFMQDCLEKQGVLHVTTENPYGDDIIINVTIIKPRPDMSYEEVSLLVWNWPYLCVREIKEGSIFEHTVVQEMDQISAINDIDCSNMRKKGFAQCINELHTEITLTLIRRKHRYTGSFS